MGRLKVAFYHFCIGLPLAAPVVMPTTCVSLQSAALLPYACLLKSQHDPGALWESSQHVCTLGCPANAQVCVNYS